MTAQGTIEEQNSIYLDSLTAKTKQLKNAQEGLISAFADSDSFKGFLDIGTEILNLFTDFIKGIGGGGNALLTFGSLLGNVFSKNIAQEISSWVINIKNAKDNVQQLSAQYQILSKFQKSNIGNAEVQDLIGMKQQELDLGSLVSPENDEYLNSLIEAKEALYEQRDAWEADKQAAAEYLSHFKEINDITNIGIDDAKAYDAEIKKHQRDLKEAGQSVSTLQKANKNLNQSFRDYSKVLEANSQDEQQANQALEHMQERFDELREAADNLSTVLQNDSNYNLINPEKQAQLQALTDQLHSIDITSEDAGAAISDLVKRIIALGNSIRQDGIEEGDRYLRILTSQVNGYGDGLQAKINSVSQTFNKALQNLKITQAVQQVVEFTSAIGLVAGGVQSITGAFRELDDENASFADKAFSFISGISSGILTIYNGVSEFTSLLPKVAQLMNATAAAAITDAIETKGALAGIGVALKSIGVSLLPILPILIPIAAAIAAITAAIYLSYKATHQFDEELKKAEENLSAQKKLLEDTTNAYNDLKSSIEDYTSAQDAISKLTAGTQEWKDAIEESNDKVIALMENYKELAQYVTIDPSGRMTISTQGINAVQQHYKQQSVKAQTNQLQAEITKNSAQNNNNLANLGEKLNVSRAFTDSDESYKKLANAAIQIAKQMPPMAEVLEGGIDSNQQKQILDILKENGITSNSLFLQEDITRLVEAIDENNATILDLGQALNDTKQANEKLQQAIIQLNFGDNAKYKAVTNQTEKTALDSLISSYLNKTQEELATEKLKNDKSTVKAYAKQNNLTNEEAARNLVLSDAIQKTNAQMSTFIDTINRVKTSAGDAAAAILSFTDGGSNGSLFSLTPEQVANLFNRQDFSKIIEQNYKDLGFESAEAFHQALLQARNSYNQELKSGEEQLKGTVKEFFDNLDLSQISGTDQLQISKLLKQIFISSLADQDTLKQAFEAYTEHGIQGLEQFTNKLNEVGTAAERVDLSVLSSTLDKLQSKSTLSADDYNAMITALGNAGEFADVYFTKMADGTYKLTGDAQEFYKLVNSKQRNQLENQIAEDRDRYNTLATIGSGLTGSPSTFGLKEQLTALKELGYDDQEQLATWFDKLHKGATFTTEDLNNIAQAISDNKDRWGELTAAQRDAGAALEADMATLATSAESLDDLSAMLNTGKISIQAYARAFTDVAKAQAEANNFDFNDIKAYAQSIEKSSKAIQKLRREVKATGSAIDDLDLDKNLINMAIAQQRAYRGAETLSKNWDDWNQKLKNPETVDFTNTINDMKQAVADLTNTTADAISNDTIINNLDKIKAAAQGDTQALWDLQKQAAQDYLVSIGVQTNDSQIAGILGKINSEIARLKPEDIEVGASIDDTALIEQLNNLAVKSQMTAQQMASYLGTMSMSANIKTKSQPVHRVFHLPVINMEPTENGGFAMKVDPHRTQSYDYYDTIQVAQIDTSAKGGGLTWNGNGNITHENLGAGWNAGQAKGSKKGSGGGSGSKYTPKKVEKLEKFESQQDRYHDINEQLDDLNQNLTDVSRIEDHLSGSALVANLNAQNKALDKQNKLLHQKITLEAQEEKELKKRLTKQGFSFDQTGDIINYNQQLAKREKVIEALRKKYNALADKMAKTKTQKQGDAVQKQLDAIKQQIDAEEKKYEQAKQTANKYEELRDTIDDNLNTISDNTIKIFDNSVKKFEAGLDAIDKRLKKIQRVADKLVGGNLIKNLNEQIKLLQKQQQYAEKQAKTESNRLTTLQSKLSKKGFKFAQGDAYNPFGDISNINQMRDKIDSKLEKLYADPIKNAKAIKKWENIWSQAEEYLLKSENLATLTNETIPDLIDQALEKNINKFNVTIDLQLDIGDFDKQIEDWKHQIFKGFETDLFKEAKYTANTLQSLFNGKLLPDLNQHVTDISDALEKLRKGEANVYGDNQQKALEDLKSYTEKLMDLLSEAHQKAEQLRQDYLDMIDEAKSAFEDNFNLLEQVDKLINHNMNLLKMVRPRDYEGQNNWYGQRTQNYLAEIDMARQQAAMWENLMNSAQKGTEEYAKFRDNWIDATNNMNDAIQNSIQNILDKYNNTIEHIISDAKDKMAGGSWDQAADEWNRAKWSNNRYLDDLSRATGITSFQAAANKAMDGLSDKQKADMLKFMDTEINNLENITDLRQIDVDIANKKLQIMKQQIALEDAQNAKTSMRLRRDSQGNYTYQYVANQDQVADKQQDLRKSIEELRKMEMSDVSSTIDQIQSKVDEFYSKAQELAEKYYDDQDLLNEKLNKLYDAYFGKNGQITKLNLDYKNMQSELLNTTGAEYATLLNTLGDKTKAFLGLNDGSANSQSIWGAIQQLMGDKVPTLLEAFTTNEFENNFTNRLTDDTRALLLEDAGISYMWDTAMSHMAESMDDLKDNTVLPAMASMKFANDEYKTSIESVEKQAEISFTNVAKGIDINITKTKNLVTATDTLTQKYTEQIQTLKNLADAAATYAKTITDQYLPAIERAKALADSTNTSADTNSKTDISGAKVKDQDGSNIEVDDNASSKTPKSKKGDKIGTKSSSKTLKVGSKATLSGSYYYDSNGNPSSGSKYAGQKGGVVVDKIAKGQEYAYHIAGADGVYKDLGWVKKSQLKPYDTGGYTGDWSGNGGRLALLHKKELILNAADTQNTLMAMKIANNIIDSLSSLGQSAMNRMAAAVQPIAFASPEGATQSVIINADFPNVSDALEIKNALNNLVNRASQLASQNRRTY